MNHPELIELRAFLIEKRSMDYFFLDNKSNIEFNIFIKLLITLVWFS